MNELSTDWTGLLDIELKGLSAPQQARWSIREQLAGNVSVSFLRDVMLATSEVVTNAIRYAPGPCRLTMTRNRGSACLRIAVSDGNPEFPHSVDPTDDPMSRGRGLMIVDTVASAWGTAATADGKEVWFEMTPEQRS